jgi:hypothetical protein
MEKRYNFFTDKSSIKTIDSHRIFYLLISVLFFFLTEASRKIYRPYIYMNNIDDFGIADSVGNLGGIIVQIFFMLAVLNSRREKAFRVIGFVVIGFIVYEILQPYLPRGVFDWRDIYGTLTGGVISLFIVFFIKKFFRNKVVHVFK